jgi:hypothetical protein
MTKPYARTSAMLLRTSRIHRFPVNIAAPTTAPIAAATMKFDGANAAPRTSGGAAAAMTVAVMTTQEAVRMR